MVLYIEDFPSVTDCINSTEIEVSYLWSIAERGDRGLHPLQRSDMINLMCNWQKTITQVCQRFPLPVPRCHPGQLPNLDIPASSQTRSLWSELDWSIQCLYLHVQNIRDITSRIFCPCWTHHRHESSMLHDSMTHRSCWTTNLWSLIGHKDTLSPSDRIIHILAEVVPLDPDQVTGWGCLTFVKNDGGKVRMQLADPIKARFTPQLWNYTSHPPPISLPSLKSRPSSWLGQRFTTSVTCSAFL